jgi:lipopolysaccharide transport system ATP-binding protein
MPSIDVKRLSKRYTLGTKQRQELWALRDVSFNVEGGEILGIIGPNGAGKTTLLKVLSRVTPPTEGRVVGSGRVVPLLALGAGFQQDVSGRENIYLNAAIYGVSAADVDKRLDDIIEFADIGDFIDVPVKRYSSGMYLRLAFSVAINMNPDILLADEVLAVGDIDFQERCLERVKQAGRDGMIVLFVSHDMAAITRLCSRVLWLNAGEIVKIGDPDEVVADYQNASWSMTGRRIKDTRSGSHKNAAGELLFVMLTGADGREVGAVRAADEVFVKVGVRIDVSDDITVRFVLHVNAHGSLAFRVRSEFFEVNATGIHVATIRVPPDLLAETIYSVSVDAVIVRHGTEKFPLAAFNALSFQVFDPATKRRDTLGGMVAPKLDWTFSLQPQTAPQPRV